MSTPVPELHVVHPRTIADAIDHRNEHASSRFMAGGTDLLINMRHGLAKPDVLIDLSRIPELGEIRVTAEGLCIGPMLTLSALAENGIVATRYRALMDAAKVVAGPGHRVLATVGGNLCLETRCIYYNQSEWWRRANSYCLKGGGDSCHVAPQGQHCHAAFVGDLAPALLALGAEAEIAGTQGRRRVALGDMYLEDGRAHLALAPAELLVALHLPPHPPRSSYAKARVRGAIDYPLAGVGVALATDGAVVNTLRIGLTGTNSRPFLLKGTESVLGRRIDAEALHLIDRLVQKQVQPMRTTIASAHYRRLVAAALACRLLTALAAERDD
jgi:4-hydroxybenzoyl-CoA reductase subunit beta